MGKFKDTLMFKFLETFLVIMGICYLSRELNITFLNLGEPFGSFTGQVLFSFVMAVTVSLYASKN